jgi:predicted RNA binding protein YcfA (HicA-like mRNA interferase family)
MVGQTISMHGIDGVPFRVAGEKRSEPLASETHLCIKRTIARGHRGVGVRSWNLSVPEYRVTSSIILHDRIELWCRARGSAWLLLRERREVANADRILERLYRDPPDMTFSNIETLPKHLGWEIRQGGKPSHYIVTSTLGRKFTIANKHGRRIKQVYLRQIRAEIDRGAGT